MAIKLLSAYCLFLLAACDQPAPLTPTVKIIIVDASQQLDLISQNMQQLRSYRMQLRVWQGGLRSTSFTLANDQHWYTVAWDDQAGDHQLLVLPGDPLRLYQQDGQLEFQAQASSALLPFSPYLNVWQGRATTVSLVAQTTLTGQLKLDNYRWATNKHGTAFFTFTKSNLRLSQVILNPVGGTEATLNFSEFNQSFSPPQLIKAVPTATVNPGLLTAADQGLLQQALQKVNAVHFRLYAEGITNGQVFNLTLDSDQNRQHYLFKQDSSSLEIFGVAGNFYYLASKNGGTVQPQLIFLQMLAELPGRLQLAIKQNPSYRQSSADTFVAYQELVLPTTLFGNGTKISYLLDKQQLSLVEIQSLTYKLKVRFASFVDFTLPDDLKLP